MLCNTDCSLGILSLKEPTGDSHLPLLLGGPVVSLTFPHSRCLLLLLPLILDGVLKGLGSKILSKSIFSKSKKNKKKKNLNLIFFRSCKEKYVMKLLRTLFFIEAHHQLRISAVHIPGVDNNWTDYLSRNQIGSFYASHHTANPAP